MLKHVFEKEIIENPQMVTIVFNKLFPQFPKLLKNSVSDSNIWSYNVKIITSTKDDEGNCAKLKKPLLFASLF